MFKSKAGRSDWIGSFVHMPIRTTKLSDFPQANQKARARKTILKEAEEPIYVVPVWDGKSQPVCWTLLMRLIPETRPEIFTSMACISSKYTDCCRSKMDSFCDLDTKLRC